MSEPINAAPPAASKRERKALGRNQRIAVHLLVWPFLLTLAMALFAMLRSGDGPGPVLGQWISFVGSYVPLGLTVVLGGGAAVKGVVAVADAMKARK